MTNQLDLQQSELMGYEEYVENLVDKLTEVVEEKEKVEEDFRVLTEAYDALVLRSSRSDEDYTATVEELTAMKESFDLLTDKYNAREVVISNSEEKVAELEHVRGMLLAQVAQCEEECHRLQDTLEDRDQAFEVLARDASAVSARMSDERRQLEEAVSKKEEEVLSFKTLLEVISILGSVFDLNCFL